MFSSKREHFCRVYVVEPCITETERSIKHRKKSWWKWESKSLILQYDQWLHLQTLRRFQYVQWWHFLFRQLHQKKGTLQQTISLTVKQLPRLQQRRFIVSLTVFILMLVLNILFGAVLHKIFIQVQIEKAVQTTLQGKMNGTEAGKTILRHYPRLHCDVNNNGGLRAKWFF